MVNSKNRKTNAIVRVLNFILIIYVTNEKCNESKEINFNKLNDKSEYFQK